MTPASISGLRVAGPSVATILVRRISSISVEPSGDLQSVELIKTTEELLRVAPAPGRYPQRDVPSAEPVERPIGRDCGLDPGFGEMLSPRPRRLEVLEVVYDLPVVEPRVTDVQLPFSLARHGRNLATRGRHHHWGTSIRR